jgi:hypothetical protein
MAAARLKKRRANRRRRGKRSCGRKRRIAV